MPKDLFPLLPTHVGMILFPSSYLHLLCKLRPSMIFPQVCSHPGGEIRINGCKDVERRQNQSRQNKNKEERIMAITITFITGILAIIGVGAATNDDFWDF